MNVTENTRGVTILTPSDGYKITQAADVDDTLRGFWSFVALATNDSADNYTEWTEEEAEAFIAELEAKLAEEEAEIENN